MHLGGPRKLGHVNCLTSRIHEGVAFYTEVLRMRLSDWLGDDEGRGPARVAGDDSLIVMSMLDREYHARVALGQEAA